MKNYFNVAYVNIQSPVHKINARIKLLAFAAGIVYTLLCKNIYMYAVDIVLILIVTKAAKLKITYLLNSVKKIWVLLLTVLVMNTLFFSSENAIFSFWIFSITKAGFLQGAHICANVILLVCLSTVFMAVTSPMQMTEAVDFYLTPLKYIGVPTDNLTLILTVSIRFIPILFIETQNIKMAQISRGAEFESKNPFKKAKCILPLVVPIFISAFKRADELSQALEARGYGFLNNKEKKEKKHEKSNENEHC